MDVSHHQLFDPRVELAALGCREAEIARILTMARVYTLKIRDIGQPVALLISRIAQAAGAGAAVSHAGKRHDGLVDVVLTGTENQFTPICEALKGASDGAAAVVGDAIEDNLSRLRRKRPETLLLHGQKLPLGRRTLIMGILNLTPDSFSDGGRYFQLDVALEHARRMVDEGADILDLGGESTRPGALPVSAEEECSRVLPLIAALRSDPRIRVPLSIDTYKATTARAALDAGVAMVNDVWALKGDPGMAAVIARYGATVCLMHNRTDTRYRDLVPDMIADLRESIRIARTAGIPGERILVDPGIGFGKDLAQNLEVMRRLGDFRCLGYPILLGTSRKSMIGKTLDLPVDQRLEGTAATVAFGIAAGAQIIRVHDIRQMKQVARMTDAMMRGDIDESSDSD